MGLPELIAAARTTSKCNKWLDNSGNRKYYSDENASIDKLDFASFLRVKDTLKTRGAVLTKKNEYENWYHYLV